MAEIGQDILKAAFWLQKEELVAIPTETVYGLAGKALSPQAVAKIFSVKNRPSFNPLILHTAGLEQVKSFVKDIPGELVKLAETFWPGPLTLLLQKKMLVPDIVTAGLPTVAVRIPSHPLTLQLLQLLDFPLAAPSANPFKYISPTSAHHVEQQLGDKISYILDGGNCQVGIESTIIGLENGQVTVFRLGGIELEKLEAALGKKLNLKPHSSSSPQSPGMLRQHYAPGKKLIIGNLEDLVQKFGPENCGILAFREKIKPVSEKHQVTLSPNGDFTEAAAGLFAALRYLDKLPITFIFAELLPEKGLGRAINDRLKRAAAE